MERLICLAIGYVCGLFQTGYLVGKFYKVDIRQHGSGNAGTTNALRTLGKLAGALTLLGDFLKCMLAIVLARLALGGVHPDEIPLITMYAAAGCILGHNFPFYMGFRGGKGVACSVGLGILFDWRVFLICLVIFCVIFATTHYVSLGSITIYTAGLLLIIFFGQRGDYGMAPSLTVETYVVMAFLTCLAIFRHRKNIQRLLNGTESKVYISKAKRTV